MPRRVPMPAAESKQFACSCGRYGPGNQYGVATHRSKSKCGGQVIILLDEDEPAAAPAAGPDAATPAGEPDVVIVDGAPAAGRITEPKGAAPTTFKQQVETTAELRVYYDYFHVALKYEADFPQFLEEMARLAIEELFGFELTMRVRQRQRQEALGA